MYNEMISDAIICGTADRLNDDFRYLYDSGVDLRLREMEDEIEEMLPQLEALTKEGKELARHVAMCNDMGQAASFEKRKLEGLRRAWKFKKARIDYLEDACNRICNKMHQEEEDFLNTRMNLDYNEIHWQGVREHGERLIEKLDFDLRTIDDYDYLIQKLNAYGYKREERGLLYEHYLVLSGKIVKKLRSLSEGSRYWADRHEKLRQQYKELMVKKAAKNAEKENEEAVMEFLDGLDELEFNTLEYHLPSGYDCSEVEEAIDDFWNMSSEPLWEVALENRSRLSSSYQGEEPEVEGWVQMILDALV